MYRILDANLDRAREALRVVEDHARFVLGFEAAFLEAKALRHSLAVAAGRWLDGRALAASRDSSSDIGSKEPPINRVKAVSAADIVTANLKRFQEALRVLEEFSKLRSSKAAAEFSALRFRAYALEEMLQPSLHPHARLASARLYVLVTGSVAGRPAEDVVRECLKGGADVIQLREKDMLGDELMRKAMAIRSLTREAGAIFIMDDRVDIALACGADGVHVGREDIPVRSARSLLGPDKIVGSTAHDIAEARAMLKSGADYVSVGPVFSAKTKLATLGKGSRQQGLIPCGLGFVRDAARSLGAGRFFAIGGIGLENLRQTLSAGAERVAVCSAVIASPDPRKAAAALKKMLK